MKLDNIDIIEAKSMSDDQWRSFALMEEFLKKEIYPRFGEGEDTSCEKVRDRVLNSLRGSEISFANNYYFFERSRTIASLEVFERKGILYFVYDYYGKVIPAGISEMVFDHIKKIMNIKNYDEAMFHTFYERHFESALKTDAEIFEESLTSRLLKKDINFARLEKMVTENTAAGNYELRLLDTIPEDLFERYVEYINEIYQDANEFHPKKEKPRKFSLNDLKARVQDLNDDKSPFYLFILFDEKNIAAFCSAFVDKMDGKYMIEHRGGFTTTGRKYRGKGLAKFLKAKLYLKVQKDYPDFEFILTDTFPWNKYMYRINEEFGFEPFQKGYTFRIMNNE